jgi:uncharacterized protein
MPLALDDPLLPAQPGPGRRAGALQVSEPIRRFTRLAEVAGNPGDALEIDLVLDYADDGSPLLEGAVQGEVELVCQRCLGPLRQPVHLALRLALVPEGQSLAIPAGFEAWEMPGEQQRPPRVRDLVEDEVILALPLIARHDRRADCERLSPLLTAETGGAAGDEAADERGDVGRDNPFAVLKGLKTSDPD